MSVLTVYLIFQIVKNFPILFHYLGLVINGASWQQLLQNLDPITGTRMYNQLLKLINERRERKKMIEEKESLNESVVKKRKKGRNVSSSRPKKVVLSSRPKKKKGQLLEFETKKNCLEFKTKKNGNVSSSRQKKIS